MITTILNLIYSAWTWLSIQTRVALVILLVCLGMFIYYAHQKNIQKQEAEKQLNQWIESKAQQDQQKINESKAEANSKQENVNKLLENVNRIRSGNINRTINRSDLENILREK